MAPCGGAHGPGDGRRSTLPSVVMRDDGEIGRVGLTTARNDLGVAVVDAHWRFNKAAAIARSDLMLETEDTDRTDGGGDRPLRDGPPSAVATLATQDSIRNTSCESDDARATGALPEDDRGTAGAGEAAGAGCSLPVGAEAASSDVGGAFSLTTAGLPRCDDAAAWCCGVVVELEGARRANTMTLCNSFRCCSSCCFKSRFAL